MRGGELANDRNFQAESSSPFDGEAAKKLRSLRFNLDKLKADGQGGSARACALAMGYMAFIMSESSRSNERTGASLLPDDHHATPFRAEAYQTAARYLASTKAARSRLWERTEARLGLKDDPPVEGGSAGDGDPDEGFKSMLMSLPAEYRAAELVAGRLEGDEADRVSAMRPLVKQVGAKPIPTGKRTFTSPKSPAGPPRKSPPSRSWPRGASDSCAAGDPPAQKRVRHPGPLFQGPRGAAPDHVDQERARTSLDLQRQQIRANQRWEGRRGPAGKENAAAAPAGGEEEDTALRGAAMFQSAKQALHSRDSEPSRHANYAQTIQRKASGLGWDNPNLHKRQRRRAAEGEGGEGRQYPAGQGASFVPPYVRKALAASCVGSNAGNGLPATANAGKEEPPFSPKVMEMLLGAAKDGVIPEEVLKLDKQLVDSICSDIIERPGVEWDDIVGQEDAKRLVQEMVVWPMLNPDLFKGVRTPPKGLLLFGPPGTGKTLIGKAIASNIKATFFNISASSLTSKWIGEGEKMVKTLFTLAGCLQPSVIFIDEIDSVLSARKSDGEHEASRRLKTEVLVQMEGCDPSSAQRRVLIVGATNRPEELDEAARRRLPKQLYVPLPCAEARRVMLTKGIAQVRHGVGSADFDKIVAKTQGYSGSDMRNFIQEACQGPVRDALAGARGESDIARLSEHDLRNVVLRDFALASRAQKASVAEEEIRRYDEYNTKHGASYKLSEDIGDDW